MPQQQLTIVPVTLLPDSKKSLSSTSTASSFGLCTIKTENTEISFHNGVEERIIQIVMKELRHL